MNIRYSFKVAFSGLRTNKVRSFLTILGIVIGITSIILIMSLGQGAQNLILNQIQGQMGSRVIEIRAGKEPKGPTDFLSIMFSDSLKQKDVDALEKKGNVPNATGVMPLVFATASASYGGDLLNVTLYGMTDLATRMYNLVPEYGRFITDEEVKSYSDSIVVGHKVVDQLFPGEEALGKKIKIKGKNFRIVGILGEKGPGSAIGDDVVVIPYTTAQRYITGTKYFIHIIVEADTEANVNKTVEDIKATIRSSHNITDPSKDDFSVGSQADAIKMVGSVMSILTLFLVAVAAISLIVGGVGIMNIMLVSVTERTREIGLRKAVGATNGDILRQFLFESVTLTVVGGVTGITLGAFLSFLMSLILTNQLGKDWPFSLPLSAVLLGVGVSAFIGMVFGIFPARKASLKNPIESLRYE